MSVKQYFKFDKYTKIEVIFFLVYFYFFRLLTDLEYNLYERKHFGVSSRTIEDTLVLGTTSLIAFLVFYKVLIYCLEKNKLKSFLLFVLLFLFCYHFYQKATYLLISNLDFLSEKLRNETLKWFNSKTLSYTLSYMIRELLAISALAYFIHSAKQAEQMKMLKEQQLISELTYLKAQLQPHFFFNTLNNIYSLALIQSAATAPLVAKLAEMMRYILYKADEKLVPLRDEIAFIQNYVEVERIRYRSAIKINFETQGIDEESKISPLLLLPFVENSFKHGIQEEEKDGFVTIIICKTQNELTLEVKNSIAKNEESVGGIGLSNVRKRLEILYPEKHELTIENNGKIYQVSLTLEMT